MTTPDPALMALAGNKGAALPDGTPGRFWSKVARTGEGTYIRV